MCASEYPTHFKYFASNSCSILLLPLRSIQSPRSGLDVKDASLSTVSAETAGEDVVEIGRAALTLAGGQVVPVKYVVHWKRHEGNWKWHTDIWNMNQ